MDIKKIIFGDQVGAAEAIAPADDDLQGSLPIADIKYGVMQTRDGGYAALFEVLPTNFFLQSTAERTRIISSFAAWLRIAPDSLQILCLSQPVDVEQYTRRMEDFLQSEQDALCRTCIEDNIREVNQLVRYGAFTTRFYIAYRYEPSMVSGKVSYAKIAAALRQVMDSSVGYLARCGLTVVNPGYIDNHLVQTVFGMLCKHTSEQVRLPSLDMDLCHIKRAAVQAREAGYSNLILVALDFQKPFLEQIFPPPFFRIVIIPDEPIREMEARAAHATV